MCPFWYWLVYINNLMVHMYSYNDTNQFNFYLFSAMYNTIHKNKKHIKTNELFNKFLINPLNKLVDHMNRIFNVFDINTYVKNDLSNNNINFNNIVFFLLDINKKKSRNIINHFFENEMFDLYGDLNIIIFKHILSDKNCDFKKIVEMNKKYPYLNNILIQSLKFTKNKSIIDNLFNSLINGNQFSHSQITQLISNNKYFMNRYTSFFINNYNDYTKIISLNSKAFARILNQLILSQTDYNVIKQLLDKLNSIDNSKFVIKMKQSRNILFNKLFKKNMIKKIFEDIKN